MFYKATTYNVKENFMRIPPVNLSALQKCSQRVITPAEKTMQDNFAILCRVAKQQGIEPFIVETRNGVVSAFLNPKYAQYASVLGVSFKI